MKEEHNSERTYLQQLISLYQLSVRNVPILKYSWVIISGICLMAIIALFKLDPFEVCLFTIGVLVLSFLGFIFSSIVKGKDKPIRIALYIVIYAIITTLSVVVLSFGSYIIFESPKIFDLFFVEQSIVKEPLNKLLRELEADYHNNFRNVRSEYLLETTPYSVIYDVKYPLGNINAWIEIQSSDTNKVECRVDVYKGSSKEMAKREVLNYHNRLSSWLNEYSSSIKDNKDVGDTILYLEYFQKEGVIIRLSSWGPYRDAKRNDNYYTYISIRRPSWDY
ncbi:MAG: hypothetical protein SFW35_03415 [Chitinophagales bacterium]|nr:hypothetical protein [Chitinophagales bacterium]